MKIILLTISLLFFSLSFSSNAHAMKVHGFICNNAKMETFLEKIKTSIKRITVMENGTIQIVMIDDAIVYIQTGSGCVVSMTQ